MNSCWWFWSLGLNCQSTPQYHQHNARHDPISPRHEHDSSSPRRGGSLPERPDRTRSIPGSGSRRTANGRPTSTARKTASSRCSGSRSAVEIRNRSPRTPPTRPSPRGHRSATGSRSPSSATGPTSGGSIRSRSRAEGSGQRASFVESEPCVPASPTLFPARS